MVAVSAALILAVASAVSAQFYPLKCGNQTADVSACLFQDDSCYFFDDFDTLSAVEWGNYTGDPSTAHFVIEAGLPYVNGSILYMPLIKPPAGVPNANATIMSTTRFMNYGSFEARLATVGRSGVVSTLISISNTQDEIDFEMVPKDAASANEVQANWYHNGEQTFNVDFQAGEANNNTYDNFHIYNVTWTPDVITWSLDGVPFDTVVKSSLGNNSYRYPATPSRIQFGVWNPQDNAWAGDGNINFDNLTSELHVRIDYMRVIGYGCTRTAPLVSSSSAAAATASQSAAASSTATAKSAAATSAFPVGFGASVLLAGLAIAALF
ncbi:concanavalin A-like lectin/glucanase domain-containing protein [Polychytrium aggregatum]|uniref:concanavalin A-like lectin/glucanase domain-containing protein n=1 Tax=Polychytrium aggregatum TaxID=110093 RepID=UPI0022FDF466|nr:concanavalin A-like lectin/glucanase domain-containing protein [Polychytrium aggregatum]KAI9206145.1 concanavalin A-like lectin/glucanase domain-containing protein [Polychytrium aggregatum]